MLPRISDSNYVPLSATQAPVTGLTDILTPVNLLPNSDFSRSDGYATTQTYNSINANSSNIITTGFYMSAVNCSMSNVTVAISNGSVNISGTITSLNQSGGFSIRLASAGNILKTGTTYTIAMKARAEESSSCSVGGLLPWLSSTYERIYLDTTNGVHVVKSNSSSYAIFEAYLDSPSINDYINITFYDCAVYEGEFKNPPATTSLDVKPGIGFITSPMSSLNLYPNTYTINFNSTGDPVGWYSICQLPYFSSGHTYFFEYFYSAYATGYDEAVLRLTVGYVYTNSKKVAYLDVEKTFNSSLLTSVLDNFRIAYDNSKSRMYLQVHKNTTGVYVHSYLTQLIGADSRHADVTLYRGYVFNYAELNDSLTSVAVKTPRLIGAFS